MGDKSSISVIALPKSGGALHGIGEKFSPDLHTGTGNFTVPLALPPGRNGFQPQLTLVYSTGNGNGPFGLGWNLSLPGISRKTSKGVPRYRDDSATPEEQDTFILSGAEDLVPVTPVSLSRVRYRPRTEGLFAHIEHIREQGQDFWEVQSKDGLVSHYGTKGLVKTDQSARDLAVIADPNPNNPGHNFAWKLTRTTDPFDNRIEYSYERDRHQTDGHHHWDQIYLSKIQYGDYKSDTGTQFLVSVTFEYTDEDTDRPDPFSEYRSGFEIRTRKRCTRIVIRTHADTERRVRTYHLVYLDEQAPPPEQQDPSPEQQALNPLSLLHQVWVEGHDSTAENLLTNADFELVGPEGPSTELDGIDPPNGKGGPAAALKWYAWNSVKNPIAKTITKLLPSTCPFGGRNMVYFKTNSQGNHLYQPFDNADAGPTNVVAAVWVYVIKGSAGLHVGNLGAGNPGFPPTSTTNRWELLQGENVTSPANEFLVYAASEGENEFYVAMSSVSIEPRSEWLPPIEFNYTRFEPERRKFAALTERELPARSLANPDLELVDLFGNGLPDILEMNGTVRYWRNLGGGEFDRPRPMSDAPAGLALADAGVQLIDANGDGRADLLVTNEALSGYYPLAFNGVWDHKKSFQRYPYAPSFNLEDPEVRLVDLTGDGITDALRSGTRFECFFNDPYRGWDNNDRDRVRRVERKALEEFPNVNFSDPRVKWADMTGDGLQDIVLIHNGRVDYWPNLGYGQWGKRITMRTNPRFEDAGTYGAIGYDPKRVLLGDVDGDGVADLIYVGSGHVTVSINQTGNGWSEPITIHGTPPITDLDAVRLADIYGTGTAGILWSYDFNTFRDSAYKFLDLTGGVKPYLLNEMNNHTGAVTKVQYGSSTEEYLRDEKKRKPSQRWRTPLPFPVQVVKRVEAIDKISKGKLTTEYHYHHGYWDGIEREFRGFGTVQQFDTESFEKHKSAALQGAGALFQEVDQKYFSPPLLTKTWFHQGPVDEDSGDWRELDWSDEYWSGDPQLLKHTEAVNEFLKGVNERRVKREALRTLRGSILRTELYASDGSPLEDKPYTVTEYSYGLSEVDPPVSGGAQRLRIFFPYQSAQRTTQWERGNDPMTQFTCSRYTTEGGVDPYGRLLAQTQIACFRGWLKIADNSDAFLATRIVNDYAAPLEPDKHYIHDRIAGVTSYEITNNTVAADDRTKVARTVSQMRDLADNNQALRIIGQTVNSYDGIAFDGLPFGQLEDYGALVRTESLVLTEKILQDTYGDSPPPYLKPNGSATGTDDYPQEFHDKLPATAGYMFRDKAPYATGYFVATERRRYDFQESNGRQRGLVTAKRDALGNETIIAYDDPYQFFPNKVTDPAGLTTTARYDYRVFQPEEVTDPNGNKRRFTFTPLGFLKTSSVQGADGQGDLEHPSVWMEYNFLGFVNRGQPICVRTLRRLHHDTEEDVPLPDRDETIETREYSDGFGRLLQTRTRGESERFGDPVFGDDLLPRNQTDDNGTKKAVTGHRQADHSISNVVVSGWQRYDNKGRVVEKYEPFFDVGWDYDPRSDGKLGKKAIMLYDSRGRVFRTVNPDESEQRVVYGVAGKDLSDPNHFKTTPWETYTYDANDNAGRTHQSSSTGYQHHWNTPASIEIDALGRTIKAVERNGLNQDTDWYTTQSTYDIRGNLLIVNDALGRDAFRHVYDLANRPWRIDSIDAGVRRTALDAAGNVVEQRDGKGALILHAYDPLNRPTHLWARDNRQEKVTLRERLIYGDDSGLDFNAGDSARDRNLRGKLYRHYDEAGLLVFEHYDFKGNLAKKTRRVITDEEIRKVFDQPPAGGIKAFRINWPATDITKDFITQANSWLDQAEYRISTNYDALNRIEILSYPEAVDGTSKRLLPQYNRAGALDQVKLDDEVYVERIAYNAKGQRVLIAYGNGVMTRYAYDQQTFRLSRLRTERFTKPDALTYAPVGEALQDFAYEYDLVGNIIQIHDRTPASGIINTPLGPDAIDRSFSYDPVYRLLSATGRECEAPPSIPANQPWNDSPRCTDSTLARPYTETYDYDPAGNMTKLSHTQVLPNGNSVIHNRVFELVSDSGSIPTSNRLKTVTVGANVYAYEYDDNGNLTRENTERHFEWDHSDRMRAFRTQAANTEPSVYAHYLYDAGGQRVKKLVRKQGGEYEVTVCIDGIFEYHRLVKASATQENNTLNVMDNQSRIAMVRVGNAFADDGAPEAVVKYHLGDHLGSSHIVIGGATAATANEFMNREEYSPYGETSFGSFARKRYRFTGKEQDEESGLYYHGARYYAPWLCRWVSCDPAGKLDHLNLYVYTRNNPQNHIDKSGRGTESTHYYTTYVAGLMVGLDPDVAARTAFFTQMPDEVLELDAANAGKAFVLMSVSRNRDLHRLEEVWNWMTDVQKGGHSLTGDVASYERHKRAEVLLGLIPGTPAHGQASHALQDSYYHEVPGKNRLHYPPFGHAHSPGIDDISNSPKLWEQSFRHLLGVYRAQTPKGAKEVSPEVVDKFIKEVLAAKAQHPLDDPRMQIGVMKSWIFKLAGFLVSEYEPENKDAVPWNDFNKEFPKQTKGVDLSNLLENNRKASGNREPMPSAAKIQVAPLR